MLFLRCLLSICPVSFLSPVYLVLHFVLLFFFLCCFISCNPEIPVVVQACSIPSCIPMTPVVAQDCSTTGYIPATPSLLRIVASLAWTSNCHCTSSCRPQWLTMARAHFSPFTHSFHICIKTITIFRYDQLSTTLLGFYLPFKKWTALERRVNRSVVICCTLSSWVWLEFAAALLSFQLSIFCAGLLVVKS